MGSVVLIFACAAPLGGQQPAEPIEWRYVGGDQAHTKYSRAAEITAANVDRLEIAWQWDPARCRCRTWGRVRGRSRPRR